MLTTFVDGFPNNQQSTKTFNKIILVNLLCIYKTILTVLKLNLILLCILMVTDAIEKEWSKFGNHLNLFKLRNLDLGFA